MWFMLGFAVSFVGLSIDITILSQLVIYFVGSIAVQVCAYKALGLPPYLVNEIELTETI